jgi:hypothetical protein
MFFSKLRYVSDNFNILSTENMQSSKNNIVIGQNISNFNATNEDSEGSSELVNEKRLNDLIFERIACYIFYLNFSINIVLYTFYGPQFKKTLFNIFGINQQKSQLPRQTTV